MTIEKSQGRNKWSERDRAENTSDRERKNNN